MALGVCSSCGEKNPPSTQFCVVCQNYLGWDASILTAPSGRADETGPDQGAAATRMMPRIGAPDAAAAAGPAVGAPAGPGADPRTGRGPDPAAERGPDPGTGGAAEEPSGDLVVGDRFRVAAPEAQVTIAPTGEVAELAVRVSNISVRVDGYVGEARPAGAGSVDGTPDWLRVTSAPIELLPGTDDVLRIRFQIVPPGGGGASGSTGVPRLVPAQLLVVPVRVRAMNEPAAAVELPVAVTVSVVDAPVQLRAEPRLLRAQDRPDATFALSLDNTLSNRAAQVQLSGTDPELAVRFAFEHPVVEIAPGASATVRVRVAAEPPRPGQELSRLLTVTARDGARVVETPLTFVQSTSVEVEDPPVVLQLEPQLIRVRDNPVGLARLVVDNRSGQDWAHVQLDASDPEQAVSVGFDVPLLHVPPGRTAQTQVRLHAPLPELGTEVSRAVTITATDTRRRVVSAVATFAQATSASPMTTLGVRLEPEVVRVHDSDGATVQVVLDNQRGRFRVRLQLSGSDPERAVGFAFGPPVVDLEPGQVRTVELRLAAWRPPPGQEWTRPFTVSASDGRTAVTANGSARMSSSRSAMETLALRLDPSVARLDRRRRASLSALVDNRHGAQPVRVTLAGDDPENCIRFAFAPATVDVEPGRIARVGITVDAPRIAAGQEVTRGISVIASDGRTDISAAGTLVQAAAEKGPGLRILFTLLGVGLMLLGVWLPWIGGGANDGRTGLGLTAGRIAGQFGQELVLGPFATLASAGILVMGLAAVAGLGLAARSGLLTQLSAVVAALFLLAVLFGLMLFQLAGGPDIGWLVALVGCVLAFVGGRLARR